MSSCQILTGVLSYLCPPVCMRHNLVKFTDRPFFATSIRYRPFHSFLPLRLLHNTCTLQTRSSTYPMTPCNGHPSKVLVLGSGNFGSCLASHLGDSKHEVYMWARDEYLVKHFNEHHRNPMYLVDHQFPTNITAIGPHLPSKEFTDTMDVILFAIPTQFLRYFMQHLLPIAD